jgi:molecular chaperone DnaJ
MGDVFSSFGNIFEEFFGFSGGPFGGNSRGRRGADLRYDMKIEFEDAVFGAERDIEFERSKTCEPCDGEGAMPGGKSSCSTCGGVGQVRRSQGFFSVQTACPSCRGRGETITKPCKSCKGKGITSESCNLSVKIPAGVDTGLRLRVTGEGEDGAGGAPAGDLYVILHVKGHDHFERDGEDIILHQPIGIAQAALGAKIEIPTLEGKEKIEIPSGTQHGHRIFVTGQGVPHLKGVGRGDLIVECSLVVPSKLTKEQRDALSVFADLGGEQVQKNSNGFFSKLFD